MNSQEQEADGHHHDDQEDGHDNEERIGLAGCRDEARK
jgi:hypothetical protein